MKQKKKKSFLDCFTTLQQLHNRIIQTPAIPKYLRTEIFNVALVMALK